MIAFKNTQKDERGDIKSTVTYTVQYDLSLPELMQEFRYFLLSCSYSPESVTKYIPEE